MALQTGNEEWVFVCARTEQDPERFDQETMIKRTRRTLAIPDLPIEMCSFSHWNVNAIYAERYGVTTGQKRIPNTGKHSVYFHFLSLAALVAPTPSIHGGSGCQSMKHNTS